MEIRGGLFKMIVSDGMKSRFCKDTKTPIRVFDDDVFMERLHLLDPFYGCLFKIGRAHV